MDEALMVFMERFSAALGYDGLEDGVEFDL